MILQTTARCKPRADPDDILVRRARPLMGTLVGVSARGHDRDALEQAIRGAFAEMERLQANLSEWRPDSAVSRVNQSAGLAPIRIPLELMEVMQVAGAVSRASDGAFDSTWASLSDIWKLDAPNFRPPAAEIVAAARKLVDYRDVILDARTQTAFLRRRGMRLGLGGIAKAYIAERAADLAVASGVGHMLIDAGGDVVARGRQGKRPWTVGIRDPRSTTHLLATVDLHNEVVATSGDYEHFIDVDGHRYHHLLDPRTGLPASASRSATVIAPDGALAEALSTALFILGPPGLDILSSFASTAALLVDADGVAHFTANGNERIKWVGADGSPRLLRA
jgi:thiamine biosynthesis lipoprotein